MYWFHKQPIFSELLALIVNLTLKFASESNNIPVRKNSLTILIPKEFFPVNFQKILHHVFSDSQFQSANLSFNFLHTVNLHYCKFVTNITSLKHKSIAS